MQDQEVADAVIFHVDHAIILGTVGSGDPRRRGILREKLDQLRDRHLREVDAGRFERLEESRGEPDRDDVADPAVAAATGAEFEEARVGKRRALDRRDQRIGGRLIRHMRAGIDIAIADAVLERDPPLPPGRFRRGSRIGLDRSLGRRARHGDGAVAGQPARPVLPRLCHGVAEQQAAEAGAVDEQVAFDRVARVEAERADVAAHGILVHRHDPRFGPARAVRFSKAAQIGAEQRRIELIGIAEARGEVARRTIGNGEAVTLGGGDRDRIVADRPDTPLGREAQPVMVEANIVERAAETAERMDIAVADRAEIAEVDPELEGRMRGAHEVGFVETEPLHERADMRQGRFADADDADLGRLDQMDRAGRRQQPHQRRRRHPPRRPSADHNDPRWHPVHVHHHPLIMAFFHAFISRAVPSLLHFGNTSATSDTSVYQIVLFSLWSQNLLPNTLARRTKDVRRSGESAIGSTARRAAAIVLWMLRGLSWLVLHHRGLSLARRVLSAQAFRLSRSP